MNKNIFFLLFVTTALLLSGCAKNISNEKQLSDGVIQKLQTQDKINFTVEEKAYVDNILAKKNQGKELTPEEKLVDQQMGTTSPAKFLPSRN
jgi:hypothetical protein